MSSDVPLTEAIEGLRSELVAELDAATAMRVRHQRLLQRLDLLDKRYRDRVAELEIENAELRARLRALESCR